MPDDVSRLDVSQLRLLVGAGELRPEEIAEELIQRIERIDRDGPGIRSIIEVNPQAADIARGLGMEYTGPLHGIPIVLKDNIDTADEMKTTAGSLALADSRPAGDALVARKLREAGAVILGKANMSEWANFRSTHSSSGWSGRGGQALNPYVLDRSPCGSSSGSAAAVAAGLVPVAIGTETDGSILCPAAMCGVVGMKPTVGLVSRAGVIPISKTQDTVGPMARTVADAALVLGCIAGVDGRDPATMASQGRAGLDYTGFLNRDGLKGARIGVARERYFGYSSRTDALVEDAITAMREAGASIVDPANIPTAGKMGESELTVLLYEFKDGLNSYLAGRTGNCPRSLQEIIDFNDGHASEEMPYFGQELFLRAQEKAGLDSQEYLEAVELNGRLARDEGLDVVFDENDLDAIVAPTTGPAFTIDLVNGDHFSGGCAGPAAVAGYPAITIPVGYVHGLPVGITFIGKPYAEGILIRLAYALEQQLNVWRAPEFLRTIGLM